MTGLCLGQSHLRKQISKYNSQDSLNPLWSCGFAVESTTHVLFHCPLLIYEKKQSYVQKNVKLKIRAMHYQIYTWSEWGKCKCWIKFKETILMQNYM